MIGGNKILNTFEKIYQEESKRVGGGDTGLFCGVIPETKRLEIWIGKATGSGDQGLIYSEHDGRNVAVVYDERDINLIAAAPELLKALKYLDDAINEPSLEIDIIKASDRARTAIAEAEGRS